MTFSIVRFGDVYATAEELPLLDGAQPQGAGDVQPSLIQLSGGAFDWRGGDRARFEPQEITVNGVYAADTSVEVAAKLATLNALLGVRSKLWRTDDTVQHWRTARLLEVRSPKEAGSQGHAEFTLRFHLAPGPWRGTVRTVNATLSASPVTAACTNSGNARVDDAIITITAAGSAITVVHVTVSGVSQIAWTGTLAVGQSLVIDCGARTVRNHGVDAYSGLTYTIYHKVPEWLRLQPGANSVQIHRTGGSSASAAQITYNDGWA